MSPSWLALVAERPADAQAGAPATELGGAPAGYLAGWSAGDRPRAQALRACTGILDPDGEPALVSLVLAPPGVRIAFDDPAVAHARRLVLAGRPARAVTTLLGDDSHFAGALTAWSSETPVATAREDPFARIFPARILRLGPGLLARRAPPCGPTIERYGSASPWPSDRFAG